MTIRITLLFLLSMLFSRAALSQDRFEIYGEYSYLHFNPTVTGINDRSFNGGGGGVTLYFLKIFGIKADFMGYGSTTFTKTVSAPVTLPGGGVIPAGTYASTGDMFTYLAGPVLRIPIPRITPFGEILFGVSNTNGYVNLQNSVIAGGGTISRSPTQHPFTMAVGGGIDLGISKRVAIRLVELDYVLSRYSNPLTSVGNQNNFRYCGGLVFKF
jgi:Outer membrane protein beta-barrel domain